MAYTSAAWGEVQAATGLTGLAFLANQYHAKDGDKMVLKDHDVPYLIGLGMIGDTKPAGCKLIPDKQSAQNPILGPGSLDFIGKGFDQSLKQFPIKLQKNDKITGQVDSSAVNEGSVLVVNIAYGQSNLPKPVVNRYRSIIRDELVITSANDVTYNDAAAALDTLLQNITKWLDPERNYEIFGSFPVSGNASTVGGLLTIKGLSGPWAQMEPGLLVNSLNNVLFDQGTGPYLCPDGIPIKGDAFDNVTAGMCSTTAGVVRTGVYIGEL